MNHNSDEFISVFKENLSPAALERWVEANFRPGFVQGMGRASVQILFINLPVERVRQRRGGGAEAANNRMVFSVEGFNSGLGPNQYVPAPKVKVSQLVNDVYLGSPTSDARSPNLRAKSGPPAKIAVYVAKYINQVVESFPPQLTHE